jgi:hypothetical protein
MLIVQVQAVLIRVLILHHLRTVQDKAVGALSDAMGTFEEQMGALKASYEARLAALSAEMAAEERERHSQGLIRVRPSCPGPPASQAACHSRLQYWHFLFCGAHVQAPQLP